jgi:hypothetical protein
MLFLLHRYQIFSIHCISVSFVIFFHIILSSTELVKINISVFHIKLNGILTLLMSVFQILDFDCSNEISNKWKPGNYCLPYMCNTLV